MATFWDRAANSVDGKVAEWSSFGIELRTLLTMRSNCNPFVILFIFHLGFEDWMSVV